MVDLLLPRSHHNVLIEFLRTRDGQDFHLTVQLSDDLSRHVQRFAKYRRLQTRHVLKSMLGALVSCVQAAAPHEEWREVAEILAEELKGRLMVRQENDDPYH